MNGRRIGAIVAAGFRLNPPPAEDPERGEDPAGARHLAGPVGPERGAHASSRTVRRAQ